MKKMQSLQSLALLLCTVCLFNTTYVGARKLEVVKPPTNLLKYHNGPLLSGKVSINLIWYGKFSPAQRAIVSDFILSLASSSASRRNPRIRQPSVSTWWSTAEKYYRYKKSIPLPILSLDKQILDPRCSLGKSLSAASIKQLASRGAKGNAVNIVLTSSDVFIPGFCSSMCGFHQSFRGSKIAMSNNYLYIWVGNSATQCPGQCAWPFHQPIYGPQNPPLIPPNNDVGVDGMIINLASLLAATATNPFGNGYYEGPAAGPLEIGSACTGIFGTGGFPGYPGNLLVDKASGASYNVNGVNGRKYLVSSLYDPATSTCTTLV